MQAQLTALDRWNHDRAAHERQLALAAQSREQKVELARVLDGGVAEQSALHRRASLDQLRGAGLLRPDHPRVVIGHRQQWFKDRLFVDFAARDATVIASEDDGAEVVAAAIWEQPDVLVIEDLLPTITGREILERVTLYAADTLVAVQTMHIDQAPALLAAGAGLVFGRRVPPDALVEEVVTSLLDHTGGRVIP